MAMTPWVKPPYDDRAGSAAVEAILAEAPGHEERTFEVGVHDVVPLGPGHLDDGLVQGAAGVVDQEIDLAQGAERLVERRVDARLLAQVELPGTTLRSAKSG